jgi:hypothetical protein
MIQLIRGQQAPSPFLPHPGTEGARFEQMDTGDWIIFQPNGKSTESPLNSEQEFITVNQYKSMLPKTKVFGVHREACFNKWS